MFDISYFWFSLTFQTWFRFSDDFAWSYIMTEMLSIVQLSVLHALFVTLFCFI